MSDALVYLHYLTPVLLLFPLVGTLRPAPPPLPEIPGIRPITIQTITPRRSLISTSLLLLAITAFGDIVILIADLLTARARHNNGSDLPPHLVGGRLGAEVIYGLAGLVIWGTALSAAWYRGRWGGSALVVLGSLAMVCEIPNLVGLVLRETHTHGYDKIFTILSLVPSSLRLLLLPVLLFALSYPRISYEPADETTSLLTNGADARRDPSSASEYGTFETDSQDQTKSTNPPSTPVPTQAPVQAQADATTTTTATAAEQAKKIKITKKLGAKREERKDLTFKEAWPKFKSLIPRLWPSTSVKLQFFVAMTGVVIAIDRVLTPLAPISMGFLVRALTERNSDDVWKWLAVYLVLRLLNAYGILTAIQQAFWVPVVQYTDKEMQTLCFNHLLDLSLAYHTKRNTGEVMRILERGSAINELFRTMLFNVIPTFADIIIGFSVFILLFGPLMTGAVLLIMIPYMLFTFFSTQFRKKLRKDYIEKDVIQRGIINDVLANWESVKYFTAESREFNRFNEAVTEVQTVDYQWTMGYQFIYAVQSLLLTLGFAVGSIILAWNIMRGRGDAALYVIFIQYYSSFTTPLNQLSSLYRSIQTDITDSEKMLNLLNEKTEIKDEPDAKELVITDGVIEFDNVCFTYDGKIEALKNVSFKINKGESMALVGETGSGKSTILRLLYRFYDITSGHIYIDGQDIAKVTQVSLRRAIGIVPQDSVLWNDTIGANIAYGKPDATDEEIIAAAMAGKMHDKILAFDDGYDTFVGERGVRLSGGEKQRVSLSRMFLKSPAILVLDEATSALDTETEREIQKSLAALAKGRSSLSIAHRLSTIINSDRIVVMKNGGILESGAYKDLIEQNGAFAKMWKRQIYTEAELLEDDDVEKVANSLPTADDFRRAHSYTGIKPKGDDSKPSDGPSGGEMETVPETSAAEDAPATDQSGDLITLDAKADEETKNENEGKDKKEDQAVSGFEVDASAPPPIAERQEAVSFADAVKSQAEPDAVKEEPGTESNPAVPIKTSTEASAKNDGPTASPQKAQPATLAVAAEDKPASDLEPSDPIAALHTPESTAQEESSATVPPPTSEASQDAAIAAAAAAAPSPVSPSATSVPAPTPSSPEQPKSASINLNSPARSSPISSTRAFPTESPKPPTSPTVPFPSSASASRNPNRLSTMSASPSIASAMSSVGDRDSYIGGSSPSKSEASHGANVSRSLSGAGKSSTSTPDDKGEKRRKRLSSIKGFVRRISDQTVLTRSNSGLRSPAREDTPGDVASTPEADEGTALLANGQKGAPTYSQAEGQEGQGDAEGREGKISTHGPSAKPKKKKKGGKH